MTHCIKIISIALSVCLYARTLGMEIPHKVLAYHNTENLLYIDEVATVIIAACNNTNSLYRTCYFFRNLCIQQNPEIFTPFFATTDQKNDALFRAVYYKEYDSIKKFLNHGVNPEEDNFLKFSVLKLATRTNDETIHNLFQTYITKQQKEEQASKYPVIAISDEISDYIIALYAGDDETAEKYILDKKNKYTFILFRYPYDEGYGELNSIKRINTTLHIAVYNNNIKILKLLFTRPKAQSLINMQGYPSRNTPRETSLCMAARNGYTEIVRFLLIDRSANYINYIPINVNHRTECCHEPVWYAVENGHTKVVKLLLDHHDIITNMQYGATIYGALDKNTPGIILTFFYFTLLHNAVYHNYPKIVALLLANEKTLPLLNEPCHGNYSALHIAVAKSHVEIIMQLLKAGIDVNSISTDNQTALDVAYKINMIGIPSLLIEYDAKTAAEIQARNLQECVIQ